MVLDTACSNFLYPFDLVRKCQFCAFNKSTDNLQVDKVISAVLHALCSDTCWRHTAIDALSQFKTNEDLFRYEKCKVTFGVKQNKFIPITMFRIIARHFKP